MLVKRSATRAAARAGVLLLVIAAAAACGSSGGGSGGSGGSQQQDLNKMTDAQLYAIAKTEGKLTFYTSIPNTFLPTIAKSFEKAYPGITVNALSLPNTTPVTRIEAESKGKDYTADVVSGGGDAVLLDQADLIDTSFTAHDAAPPPAGLAIPKGLAVERIMTNVISYNPTLLKRDGLPVPTGYEDFTKPEWKGKFSIKPGTADLLDNLGPAEGYDTVLQLAKALGNNSPILVDSQSLASSQVASGQVAASVSTYGQTAILDKTKDPSTTDFVNPNPMPVGVSEIAVVKNAPNPAAARLFIDWVVSQAGQKVYTSQGLTSIRTDAGNDPSVWNPAKWKPDFGKIDQSTAETNKLLAEWQAALHYQGS